MQNNRSSSRKRGLSRAFLTAAVAGSSALMLAACSSGAGAADDSLTVTLYGGTTQEATVDISFTPWAEENGVTIKQDSPSDYAKLDAMVAAGKVSWGVVQTEAFFTDRACAAGTLEKLPERVLEAAAAAEVDPEMMSECGIPLVQYGIAMGYNTETFPDAHPTNWTEFFDTKKFPGKRAFWKYVSAGTFEAALMADGVAPEDLYPLDIDRAFKKLDSIKDDLVWYETGDQQIQLLSTGEAPLVQSWSTRMHIAEESGLPVKNEINDAIVAYEHVVTPKGYKNVELAQDWMQWYLENIEVQAKQSEATNYGPASPLAVDLLDPALAASLPGGEAYNDKAAISLNSEYWAEHYEEVTERFNVWLSE